MLAIVAALALAAPAPFDRAKLNGVEPAVLAAVERGELPGAVVLIIHNDAVIYRKAFGQRAKVPAGEAMTEDTVFDLASLTKPVATATAVHMLIEEGKLALADPVAKHWPAFAANGKGEVTVEQCLLHTTGLTADNAVKDYEGGAEKAWANIANLKLEAPAGTRFRYSDVGFLTLGKVVEIAAGEPLDVFTKRKVFEPLGMKDAGYRPAPGTHGRVAPTGKRDGRVIRGEVHDPRAFLLGGVAGHAGLFGTADDLARFARMLLAGGVLEGRRHLSPESVARFTAAVEVPAGAGVKAPARPFRRSRGWDVDTSFSAPRGDKFPPGTGFGHTGFTGTSLWADPASGVAVIVLSNRVHPDDKGNATPLRRALGTLAAEAAGVR